MSKSKNKGKRKSAGGPAPRGVDEPPATETKARADGKALAEQALASGVNPAEIEKQLEHLTQEEAEMFVRILAITMKRRRFMLLGYVFALFAVLIGMVVALYVYGTAERGTFVGWVFLLPPGLAALFIYGFGKYSKKIQ